MASLRDPRLEVMVFSRQKGLTPNENRRGSFLSWTHGSPLESVLPGAWVGALATVTLDVKQTHRLKELLAAAIHDNPKAKKQVNQI